MPEWLAVAILLSFMFGLPLAVAYVAVQSEKKRHACPMREDQKPHEYEVDRIATWGSASWGTYSINRTCRHCRTVDRDFGLSRAELLHQGIDPERIDAAT